jgi:hypothetical protein
LGDIWTLLGSFLAETSGVSDVITKFGDVRQFSAFCLKNNDLIFTKFRSGFVKAAIFGRFF